MIEKTVTHLEYKLQHGLATKEEVMEELRQTFPDHPVETVVYEYRRVGNSMSCQKPVVIRGSEEVAPLVSVDVSNEDSFSGPRFQPTFSRSVRRSEMIWVLRPGDIQKYRYPYAE